jgi:EpsI family protein
MSFIKKHPLPILFCSLVLVAAAIYGISIFLDEKVNAMPESTAAFERLPLNMGEWKGQDIEIPQEVSKQLAYDKAVNRRYVDAFGHEIDVWVLFWEGNAGVHGNHLPDNLFAGRGIRAALKTRKNLELKGGPQLPVSIRRVERDSDRRIAIYWTQEGKHVLSDEDEQKADKNDPKDRPASHPARLSVLVVSEQWNRNPSDTDRILQEFTKLLAEQVFELCPWANMAATAKD